MARKTPPERLARLVECATHVFIVQGYRRTQMADIADALGVAKGTLYLYVESKEALFDLLLRCADGAHPLPALSALPLPTPAPGATIAYVGELLTANQDVSALSAALRQRGRDPRREIAAITGELYDRLAQHRLGIKLLDRSAVDQPELAALWFGGARGGMRGALEQYLTARIRSRQLRPVPDVAITARLVLETLVFWAVHRHWDAHPQAMDETKARAAVIHFIVEALAPERAAPRPSTRRKA
ncbi:MAG: TetR/AcrR family transcriptional regulator [Candidatus Binatia bacterium]